MNAQIRTLKAEILADLEAIDDIYAALATYTLSKADSTQLIAISYYLHNLYCAFESIFQRIAHVFENQISDQAGWHAELLHRMGLDIEGIRPHVISVPAQNDLDELRRFRHLFRSAYRLHLDAERLALVHQKAQTLKTIYHTDIAQFISFLDSLVENAT